MAIRSDSLILHLVLKKLIKLPFLYHDVRLIFYEYIQLNQHLVHVLAEQQLVNLGLIRFHDQLLLFADYLLIMSLQLILPFT